MRRRNDEVDDEEEGALPPLLSDVLLNPLRVDVSISLVGIQYIRCFLSKKDTKEFQPASQGHHEQTRSEQLASRLRWYAPT